MSPNPRVVNCTIELPVSAQEAFTLFTEGLDRWWPREFSWSQEVLEEIRMEPRPDGLLSEIGPHGFRCDWGRVLLFEPPARIVFSWQISPNREPVPDAAKASEVDVRFTPGESSCRVDLEHRGFERHGEGAAEYAEMMATRGWPLALERLAATASRPAG